MKRSPLSYECVEEVPLHRVRANQLGILVFIIISAATQIYWLLLVPLAVQLISRTFGVKVNLFVRAISPFLPASVHTESRELLRFNNLLAILFLLVSVVGFALHWTILGYISLAMLTVAVVLALCGFCLGCFMYFQWKQFLLRRRRASN